jgi:parallel beta-helix repeat protein
MDRRMAYVLQAQDLQDMAQSNRIEGNTIKDYGSYGIRLTFQNGLVLSGNDISRPARTGNPEIRGIFIENSKALVVEKNRIHTPFGGNPAGYERILRDPLIPCRRGGL